MTNSNQSGTEKNSLYKLTYFTNIFDSSGYQS